MEGGLKPRYAQEKYKVRKMSALWEENAEGDENAAAPSVNKNNKSSKKNVAVETDYVHTKKIQEIIEKLEKSKEINFQSRQIDERSGFLPYAQIHRKNSKSPLDESDEISCCRKNAEKKIKSGFKIEPPHTGLDQQRNLQRVETHSFNEMVESTPVINQMKNILESIAMLLNRATMRETIEDLQTPVPEKELKENTPKKILKTPAQSSTHIKAAKGKEDPLIIKKKRAQEKAHLLLQKMAISENEKRKSQFCFYRISNIPPISCAVAKMHYIWSTIANIPYKDTGLMIMLSNTEAQLAVTNESASKLEAIIDSYRKSNVNAVLSGPLSDPLEHSEYSKEKILDLLVERAKKHLEHLPKEMKNVYMLYNKVAKSKNAKDFYHRIKSMMQ
ncbi:hypothetical protein NERG_02131 [Nematocida ausubeli]|uniref:Uncharacterized protein n=1 Tax=Nematocida ausubeli (strain ATCC PRA-371 / ERTm2) TaxID=1913371 RepID=H8ZEW2_NEMA1|nr:hypothetical protein NERG_02131 [Nematocida ausubeli]